MSLLPKPSEPPKPSTSKKKENNPIITKLHKYLCNNNPNVLTAAQFKKFEPLFRKNNGLTEAQINDLSFQYQRTIDFYKPTVICKSRTDPTIIVTLPPIFTPIRHLSPTKQNEVIVSTNITMSGHNVPLYSSTAFRNLVNAIIAEQRNNRDVIMKYQTNYVEIMNAFSKLYGLDKSDVEEKDPKNETTVFDTTTWGFEE